MKKLRKQIKESFFNPIFHLLPILLFLVVDDFWGMNIAWKISFPVALILLVYVNFVYNRIFTWHLIFTLLFIVVSVISKLIVLIFKSVIIHDLGDELVIASFFLIFILFRKQIQKVFLRIISYLIPMTNNFEELYRVIWALFIVLTTYISTYVLVHTLVRAEKLYLLQLQYIYVGILTFLTIYEILRVQIIRSKLIREEWWPIVSIHGKIIGSIQHLTSLNDEKKYMHPVVRVLLVDKNMVLLKKCNSDDTQSPSMWDTSISNHVKMGETIEQCIDRSAKEKYALSNFKFMYLSNYTVESKNEKQYAFLFVSCLQTEYKLNPEVIEQTKWWTTKQIEDNLQDGIFSENFKIEFDLLSRSGLLENGKCECSCKLRDSIYSQSNGGMKYVEFNQN
ncbi:MAG: NUDIX domain-containing protein [Paludibacter sp.]|nr:NUDIX domain-containing protein [Paludibacter sp.]